ncbi:hypothetical protein G7046_g835 [Stylonectria norvegica]|nr:hypothetical protein G7046_g835 [Stylonectria norvegica]
MSEYQQGPPEWLLRAARDKLEKDERRVRRRELRAAQVLRASSVGQSQTERHAAGSSKARGGEQVLDDSLAEAPADLGLISTSDGCYTDTTVFQHEVEGRATSLPLPQPPGSSTSRQANTSSSRTANPLLSQHLRDTDYRDVPPAESHQSTDQLRHAPALPTSRPRSPSPLSSSIRKSHTRQSRQASPSSQLRLRLAEDIVHSDQPKQPGVQLSVSKSLDEKTNVPSLEGPQAKTSSEARNYSERRTGLPEPAEQTSDNEVLIPARNLSASSHHDKQPEPSPAVPEEQHSHGPTQSIPHPIVAADIGDIKDSTAKHNLTGPSTAKVPPPQSFQNVESRLSLWSILAILTPHNVYLCLLLLKTLAGGILLLSLLIFIKGSVVDMKNFAAEAVAPLGSVSSAIGGAASALVGSAALWWHGAASYDPHSRHQVPQPVHLVSYMETWITAARIADSQLQDLAKLMHNEREQKLLPIRLAKDTYSENAMLERELAFSLTDGRVGTRRLRLNIEQDPTCLLFERNHPWIRVLYSWQVDGPRRKVSSRIKDLSEVLSIALESRPDLIKKAKSLQNTGIPELEQTTCKLSNDLSSQRNSIIAQPESAIAIGKWAPGESSATKHILNPLSQVADATDALCQLLREANIAFLGQIKLMEDEVVFLKTAKKTLIMISKEARSIAKLTGAQVEKLEGGLARIAEDWLELTDLYYERNGQGMLKTPWKIISVTTTTPSGELVTLRMPAKERVDPYLRGRQLRRFYDKLVDSTENSRGFTEWDLEVMDRFCSQTETQDKEPGFPRGWNSERSDRADYKQIEGTNRADHRNEAALDEQDEVTSNRPNNEPAIEATQSDEESPISASIFRFRGHLEDEDTQGSVIGSSDPRHVTSTEEQHSSHASPKDASPKVGHIEVTTSSTATERFPASTVNTGHGSLPSGVSIESWIPAQKALFGNWAWPAKTIQAPVSMRSPITPLRIAKKHHDKDGDVDISPKSLTGHPFHAPRPTHEAPSVLNVVPHLYQPGSELRFATSTNQQDKEPDASHRVGTQLTQISPEQQLDRDIIADEHGAQTNPASHVRTVTRQNRDPVDTAEGVGGFARIVPEKQPDTQRTGRVGNVRAVDTPPITDPRPREQAELGRFRSRSPESESSAPDQRHVPEQSSQPSARAIYQGDKSKSDISSNEASMLHKFYVHRRRN